MAKFNKGDRFIPRKPKENKSTKLGWASNMDKYEGKVLVVDYLRLVEGLRCPVVDGWTFFPDWCEKVSIGVDIGKGEDSSAIYELGEMVSSSEIPNNHTMKAGIFDEHIRGELDLLENKNFMTGYPLSPQPQTLSTEIDWEQRKWEASVAAMQGLLQKGWNIYEIDTLVERSFLISEAMVNHQLKEQ